MAGKIKKGFTSYLVVLIIAVIAALLICVTIMLFSPFKSILGFQYFFYEDENYEYSVTGGLESDIFDFSTIQTIKVNCNFANVTVMRDSKVENNCIQIVNKSKGFAKDTQNTDFTYDISYENLAKTILSVEVQEPEGFLFFSKEININILIPISSSYALENTKIDITNTSGNIYIGNNTEITTEGSNEIDVNSLSIKNKSGKLLVFSYADPTFNDIFISSQYGEVEFRENITVKNTFELYSKSAELKFKDIKLSNADEKIRLDISNAKFSCKNLGGNIDLSMKSGYFDAEYVNGDIVSNNENAQMNSATITIDKVVNGALSFPFLNSSRVNISSMNANSVFYGHSTSGNINIEETYGKVYIETKSGNVNLNTYANDLEIKTKSGNINVVYNNTGIADQLDFYTVSGTINLNVKSNLAFVLAVYDTDGKIRDSGITLDWVGDKVANPSTINGGTKKIIILSNSKVNVSLIESL